MDAITIVPLGSEHLPAASELLAQRQIRLRGVRPELSDAFSQASACLPLLKGLHEREGAHGVMALGSGSRALGYLIGAPRTEEVWGRACWSPIEGQALAAGIDAEVVRDLYASWAEHFVQRGYFRQYVHAPADDPELQAAWFRTGFGQMQAHATLEIPADVRPPTSTPFSIRRATSDDVDALQPILPLIALALIRPPAFAITPPERFDAFRRDYAEHIADGEARYWLAEEQGRVLGLVAFEVAEPGPMVPEAATEMVVAMTRPSARQRGVARALIETGWADALARGQRWAVTDWRTASLPTHRSWTALGYRPTHYRLHRHIDDRIAWADGRGVVSAD
jgi:ribosomal protein S18 acetylase RimI-like enzyme